MFKKNLAFRFCFLKAIFVYSLRQAKACLLANPLQIALLLPDPTTPLFISRVSFFPDVGSAFFFQYDSAFHQNEFIPGGTVIHQFS
jgi:hypothetical protein